MQSIINQRNENMTGLCRLHIFFENKDRLLFLYKHRYVVRLNLMRIFKH